MNDTEEAGCVPCEVCGGSQNRGWHKHTTDAEAHDPRCYQSTGVPDDLPPGLCDCRVLRMIDAAEATS